MYIRYFALKNKPRDNYDGCGVLLTETDNPSIIPHKDETIIINDTVYNIYDVCYCTEYKSDYKNEVYIHSIDITIFEI